MLLIALLVAVAAAKPQFGTDEAIGSAVGSVINTADISVTLVQP